MPKLIKKIRRPSVVFDPYVPQNISRQQSELLSVGDSIHKIISDGEPGSYSTVRRAVNISGVARYHPGQNFMNVLLDAGETWRQPDGGGNPPNSAYVSAMGWPTDIPAGQAVAILFKGDMSPDDGWFEPGDYEAACAGNPALTVRIRRGGFAGTIVGSSTGGIAEFTEVAPSGGGTWADGVHYWVYELYNGTGSPQSVPPGRTSMTIIHTNNLAAWAAGEIWDPDLIADLSAAGGECYLRFMDTSGGIFGLGDSINNMAASIGDYVGFGNWPPEMCADLAKKIGCGAHYCMPFTMDYLHWESNSTTNTFQLIDGNGDYVDGLYQDDDEITLTVREERHPAFSGMDNGRYFVVNATSTNFQVSTTLGGSPVDVTADYTGPDYIRRTTRIYDQVPVWDECISRFAAHYPACPEFIPECFNEGSFSSSFISWGFVHSVLPWLMLGIRVNAYNMWQASYCKMFAILWELSETYYSSSVVKKVLHSFTAGSSIMDDGATYVLTSGPWTGERVGDVAQRVALNLYTPQVNYPQFADVAALGFLGWTDEERDNWMVYGSPTGTPTGNDFGTINMMRFELGQWDSKLASVGMTHIQKTSYEGQQHFFGQRGSMGITNSEANEFEDIIKRQIFGADGGAWRAGFLLALEDYNVDAFCQYTNRANMAYRGSYVSHWAEVYRPGLTNEFREWRLANFQPLEA